jgi:hypothetical protein
MSTNETKCTNTGNWIELCARLDDCAVNNYGDIHPQRMTNFDTGKSRLRIVVGRFKKNQITLNYCPFCGENITTDYVQEEQA